MFDTVLSSVLLSTTLIERSPLDTMKQATKEPSAICCYRRRGKACVNDKNARRTYFDGRRQESAPWRALENFARETRSASPYGACGSAVEGHREPEANRNRR